MRFNRLLEAEGIAPGRVAIMLHTPSEPALRRLLPWAAAEHPILFDAYQRTHSRVAEGTVRKRPLVASFVNTFGVDMVFAGLYEVTARMRWTQAEFLADPGFRALFERTGEADFPAWIAARGLVDRLVFTLAPRRELSECIGRLVIARPPGRSYVRLAERLDPEVTELYPAARLTPPPPDWREFVVSGPEVRALPRDWAARLAEWRGIYLIVDEADGRRYVGSAYGTENLLGRWRAHVARDRGVTVELRHRDPRGFRFSILERVGPDMEVAEVVAIENNWKARLHTVAHGLNAA